MTEHEDADMDADVEDELDDADSVQSASSLLLSSRSSKTQQQEINQDQTLISNIKSISPKLINSSSKTTTLQNHRTPHDAKHMLDTKEHILNQKPRQPSNHHRSGKVVNSIGRIKTDVDLKPVVRRAAANKASDKIAKDSAALNRNLDQSFSTSTSDASSGKEDPFINGVRHKKKGDGKLSFSTTSNSSDSCDSDQDKPIAKQKHQPTIMNSRRLARTKDSHKINSNTKKIN